MSCASYTLNGLARDCSQSMGGITEVYIANYEDVLPVAVSENTDGSKGKITSVELAEGKSFYKYVLRKGAGSFTSNATIDNANGVNYVTTDLTFNMLRMDTAKRIEMTALSVNELAVIVKDANGTYWYLGKDNAVTASAGTGATGTARTDGNMYTITLQDESATYPYEVDAAVMETLSVK